MGGEIRAGLGLLTMACLLLSACGGVTEPTGLAESDVVSDTTQTGAGGSTAPGSDAVNSTDGSDESPSQTGSDEVVPTNGPLAESSRGDVFLDSVVIERAGSSLTVRFTLSSTREGRVIWSYEMSEGVGGTELGVPTGATILDTVNGREHSVLQPEGGGCVCSPLADLNSSNPIEYFVTFDDPGVSDFELSIPTFPLIPVRDDVAQLPAVLAATGVQPGGSNGEGLVLDAVAARKAGVWTVVEFQISNPTDERSTWAYELSAGVGGAELSRPTGVTLFDPNSQSVTNPVATDERSCACSKMANIPAGGTAIYYVVFDAADGESTTVSIPGFPQTSAVPINAG